MTIKVKDARQEYQYFTCGPSCLESLCLFFQKLSSNRIYGGKILHLRSFSVNFYCVKTIFLVLRNPSKKLSMLFSLLSDHFDKQPAISEYPSRFTDRGKTELEGGEGVTIMIH